MYQKVVSKSETQHLKERYYKWYAVIKTTELPPHYVSHILS